MFVTIIWPAIGRFIETRKNLKEIKKIDLELEQKTATIRLATDEEIHKYDRKLADLTKAIEPPSDSKVRGVEAEDLPLILRVMFMAYLILGLCLIICVALGLR